MPRYRVTIAELSDPMTNVATDEVERIRVTVDRAGELDHAAIIAAVAKTKRVRRRKEAEAQPA